MWIGEAAVLFLESVERSCRDRLDINLIESDSCACEEVKCPVNAPFGRLAARQRNQVGFSIAIEFARVDAVRFLPFNGVSRSREKYSRKR